MSPRVPRRKYAPRLIKTRGMAFYLPKPKMMRRKKGKSK